MHIYIYCISAQPCASVVKSRDGFFMEHHSSHRRISLRRVKSAASLTSRSDLVWSGLVWRVLLYSALSPPAYIYLHSTVTL